METSKVTTLPRWVWLKSLSCVVEVKRCGHFPTTVMVQLPDDKVIEVEAADLETK